METKHLSYFKVENFKRFDSLEVNDIGQFNLIVGDNNVGKTSLLEALLFDEVEYHTFLYNLAYSLYVKDILQNDVANYNFFDFFAAQKSLIYQYQFNDSNKKNLLVTKRLFSEIESKYLQELRNYFVIQEPYGKLNFAIEFDNGNNKDYKFTSHVFPHSFNASRIPYISFNSLYDRNLVTFFSQRSIQSEFLDKIKTDLKFFIPSLTSIEINNALIPQQTVLAIRESGKDLIPLSQYGDGTIKLFRYLLDLEFCENKRLMIDEIDTGIHYSRMKDFLKKVMQSAKNKNVQIFATTHSKECIEYYTKALEELNMQDSGRIIRIANTKSGIKAYTMNFAEFEHALIAESEIR